MKKLLILGSAGMLGHMVYYYLKGLNKYNIIDASFPEKLNEVSTLLNVTKDAELEQLIHSERPDVLINCIGILIKGSQTDPSNAIYLNAYLPHRLSKILRNIGGRLIHISTDCVFSGQKGEYGEQDLRDADDVYGKSKALGEVINKTDLTLRTSIIGPELKKQGEGLLHWFLNQRGIVKGFTEVKWGGVSTLQIAKTIDTAISNELNGLLHVSNGTRISKYDLLNLIKTIWNLDGINILPSIEKISDKSLKPSEKFDFKVPNYETMFKELLDWMKLNKDLYSDNYGKRLI